MAKLWDPISKTLVVNGIRKRDGEIVRNKNERDDVLVKEWAKVFALKKTDTDAANVMASEWVMPMDMAGVTPLGKREMRLAIKAAGNSAAGPDGLPREAWKAAGEAGVETLTQSVHFQLSGQNMPLAFNAMRDAFSPKGEQAGDNVGCNKVCGRDEVHLAEEL